MTITAVIDVGNFSTKYCYQFNQEIVSNSFSSVIHPYKELEGENNLLRLSYNNLDYYIGDEVKNFYSGKEDKMYFGNVKKGHHEAQIRLLASLYYIYKETNVKEFNLILTSPYDSMVEDKEYFIKNFHGKRTAYVNDNPFSFEVSNIVVAAEGFGSYYYSQQPNCAIVDAGSMTTNFLYLINGSISKEDSITINGGTINLDPFEIANNVAKASPQLDYKYPIVCTGGRASEIKEALSRIGYEEITIPEVEGKETYFANSVGLLLKYSDQFEEMFS